MTDSRWVPSENPQRSFARVRVRALLCRAATVLVVFGSIAASSPAGAATSTINYSMTLQSATFMSTSGCPAASLSIGSVLIGSTGMSPSDCTITFGSNNDVSRLRMWQADGSGTAMFAWTTGTPDSAFNAAPAGLKRVVPPGGGRGGFTWGGGLAVAPDGDVLKGGDKAGDFGIGRWNPDGTLDGGWGPGGYSQVNASAFVAGATANSPSSVATLRSGKVIQVGDVTTAGANRIVVLRFGTTGTLDTTFGGGDEVADFQLPSGSDAQAVAALELPDGSLLLSGGASNTQDVVFVAKVTRGGALDLSFGGGDGIWEHVPGGIVSNANTVLLDDGEILVISSTADDAYVARLSETGILDLTFGGGDGFEVNAVGVSDNARAGGFVDDAGNIYVIGDNTCSAVVISRFTPAGIRDTAWNTNGQRVITTIGVDWRCADEGATIEMGDGRFCTGGDYGSGVVEGYWIGCFLPSGLLDPAFNATGFVLAPATNVELMFGGFAAANGKLYLGGGSSDYTMFVVGSDAQSIPDYAHPTTNFASAGGAFGACLRDTPNAAPTWVEAPGNSCAGDGNWWNGVPAFAAAAPAQVATAASGVITAQAALRFGARPGTGAKGTFRAPILLEVLAP